MRVSMRGVLSVTGVVALATLAVSCSSTSGSSGSSTTTPATPTTSASSNPCSSVSGLTAAVANPAPEGSQKPGGAKLDRHSRWNVFNLLWAHEASRARAPRETFTAQALTEDIGDVAVIQDEGEIILPANALDLQGKGVTFARNAAGGYDLRSADASFDRTLGTQLSLTDDATTSVPLGVTASFFGQSYTSAWVNSDGNITFGEGDHASTERDISRFVTGAPRIAVAFADLDPSSGGAIYASARADAFVVTWCAVPGFDDPASVTAQVSLNRDGTVTLRIAATTTRKDLIVGLSPGGTNEFKPVDLSATTATGAGATAAVGERFASSAEVDFAALAKKFYRTHGDSFDQLIIWTDQALVSDAFAFESTVSNEIKGIGVDIFDASGAFGSGGRLRSIVMMDAISKYPSDPNARVPNVGENSTMSLIGQEAGHRWLAFLGINGSNGTFSNVLLGRDDAHWSFFTDSDASVMEGNDIQDLGGGSFRTIGTVSRYSALDQYAMGLRTEAEVPPFFYVDSPSNVSNGATKDSAPRTGVTFNGTRRTVLIQDVVAALGVREPSAAQAPRIHRQAFIHLVSAGRTADSANVAKIDRFRTAWESFFRGATDGRMDANTRLR
jgi:hypothetical protein